MMVKLV